MDSNMQQERPKRPRIQPKRLEPLAPDPLAFEANMCSTKARKAISITEKLYIDIWFDKHYLDRVQHGDEFGKREGIDQNTVRALVTKSITHLLFYSASVSLFTFLNRSPIGGGNRAIRIVLQEDIEESTVNVVIEAHFININFYEITVKTAICKDDFELSDGQYSVKIDGNSSVLSKREKGVVREICGI